MPDEDEDTTSKDIAISVKSGKVHNSDPISFRFSLNKFVRLVQKVKLLDLTAKVKNVTTQFAPQVHIANDIDQSCAR